MPRRLPTVAILHGRVWATVPNSRKVPRDQKRAVLIRSCYLKALQRQSMLLAIALSSVAARKRDKA
jgi:hypothetical protein